MKNTKLDTFVFTNLKEDYESKREELQKAITELIEKGNLKDLVMIEKVELATINYKNAAKAYQDFLKNPGPKE